MTEQTKTKQTRTRAKATAVVTETPKATEEKPVETTSTTRTRARARTKPKPKVETPPVEKVEDVQKPEVSDDQLDREDVPLAKESEGMAPFTQEEVAAVISETVDNQNGLMGSADYSIGTSFAQVEKVNGTRQDHAPLVTWARRVTTLEHYTNVANSRFADGSAEEKDMRILDMANSNALLSDRPMFSFFARPGAEWNNYLPVGDRKVRSSKINFRTDAEALDLNEDQILTVLCRRLDIGEPLLVRLWHSGLVFAINPLDKADRINISDRLENARLEVLRRTNGIIHGTSSYYANRIIIQEFMKLAVNSNVDRSLWPDVQTLMDHRDIQIMAWALLATSYQRGYNYTEICGGLKKKKDADGKVIVDADGKPEKQVCGNTRSSVIDLNLIVQIDNTMYNDWQRAFITKPLNDNEKATREDIEKYQRLGKMHEAANVVIDDTTSIMIKAPNAKKHIEIGEEWINSVEDAVDLAISSDADDETRNDSINRQIEATAALDVAHWVVGFNIDGKEYRNPKTVFDIFRKLSNNTKLRDKIYEQIRLNIANYLAAQVAIPTERCPVCEELSNVINNNGTRIYTPIDAVNRFFILAARNQ